MNLMLEQQLNVNPFPFDYFCSNKETISIRYCKLCSICFVTIAALKQHKTAKLCKPMHIKCYLHAEVTEVPEEEPQTDVVPGARAGIIRNVFDLFSEQFEDV